MTKTLKQLMTEAAEAFTAWINSTSDTDPKRYSNDAYKAHKAADRAVEQAVTKANRSK